jgi:hypothetical protein
MRRILFLMLAGAPACFDEGGQDDGSDPDATDTSTQREADADTDSDTDSDADSDTDVVVGDVDHDGVTEADGDCNDADGTIHPGAEEDRNLLDDDCDGLVDEDFVLEGDVIVAEIMIDPAVCNDATGEWFELYNTSAFTIDLVGWVLSADDGDEVTISRSLVIPYGHRVVLGVSGDFANNGAVAVDYAYDRDTFDLADDTDSIFLSVDGRAIFDLTWTSLWPKGASLNLDPYFHHRIDASLKGSWCISVEPFGAGDHGTPGAHNEWCPELDRDGDLLSMAGGDCDDLDATVGPGALETWDGVDDDCDGIVDDITLDAADSTFIGAKEDMLGFPNGLGVGDWSGDGVPDLVVGGPFVGPDAIGGVYAVDAADALSATGGPVADVAFASIEGHDSFAYLGAVDPLLGDNDGDTAIDLVVAGASSVDGPMGGWFKGSSLSGELSIDDADATFEGSTGSMYITVASHVDFDGDGADEILFGDWNQGLARIDAFLGSSLTAGTSYVLGDDDAFTLTGEQTGDHPGAVIAGGDLDGDGYEDLLIGAPSKSDVETNAGAVYLVPGEATPSGSADLGYAASRTIFGESTNAYLGERGTPQIADVDADGIPDLLVGASDGESGGAANDPGATYLFFGPSLLGSMATSDADLTIAGLEDDESGMLVAAADLDGDDKDDVVSVAPSHLDNYGRVSIFSSP